jgi:hypothetical protein
LIFVLLFKNLLLIFVLVALTSMYISSPALILLAHLATGSIIECLLGLVALHLSDPALYAFSTSVSVASSGQMIWTIQSAMSSLMFILISILKTLLHVSTAVISKSVEVTWVVNPAQFTEETSGIEAVFPVVDGVATFPVVEDGVATFPVVAGVAGLAPLVKETLPVEAGAAWPVVAGFDCEVVSGLA